MAKKSNRQKHDPEHFNERLNQPVEVHCGGTGKNTTNVDELAKMLGIEFSILTTQTSERKT